jgi:hypothetical protein
MSKVPKFIPPPDTGSKTYQQMTPEERKAQSDWFMKSLLQMPPIGMAPEPDEEGDEDLPTTPPSPEQKK